MIEASKTNLNIYYPEEKIRFNELKLKFLDIYNDVNKESDYILPFWQDINNKILKQFTPFPPFDFLKTKEIIHTMFSFDEDGAKEQLRQLEFIYDSRDYLSHLIQERLCGDPLIVDQRYLASCNSIHHLYHLNRFFNYNIYNDKLYQTSTVIEFGGGYGRLPIIWNRTRTNKHEKITYVIIDTPLFTSIQWLYLSSILGQESINIIKNSDKMDIKEGLINLIPIHRIKEIDIKPDLFIALWSLSEANDNVQNIIEETNFFGTKHLFMAFHAHKDSILPNGNRLYNFVKDKYTLEPTGKVNNHFYCFS